MTQAQMMNDTELRISGIEALYKTLGATATLRFLTLFQREPTDYVEISRRIYKGQTIDEIFERAKQHWEDEGLVEENREWSAFSVASAMRGLEDEEMPYTHTDLKDE